jgi:hypothetical protein
MTGPASRRGRRVLWAMYGRRLVAARVGNSQRGFLWVFHN